MIFRKVITVSFDNLLDCNSSQLEADFIEGKLTFKARDHNFVRKIYLKNSCKTCTYTQNDVKFREISTLKLLHMKNRSFLLREVNQ